MQSNGLISVIWTLLCWKQRLRGGMLTLNMVVHTQMMLNSQVTQILQLSQKTPKKLHKLILADRKLKLCEIAEELKISEGSVFTILHEHLSMRKLCSMLVSRFLTVNQKQRVHWQFRALFATFSMQQKGVFALICDNGWNMDPPLNSVVKSAVSWVDSSRWKPSKATKDTNISRHGFGLHILGCAKYLVYRLPWERKNHQ